MKKEMKYLSPEAETVTVDCIGVIMASLENNATIENMQKMDIENLF